MLTIAAIITILGCARSASVALDCDAIQTCLDTSSKACWGEFHDQAVNRGPGDLVALTMKMVARNSLIDMAADVENSFRDDFMKIDDSLQACMDKKGYTEGVQYCANMRPLNHTVGGEKRKQKRDSSDANVCWEDAVEDCEFDYLRSNELNMDMASCMATKEHKVDGIEQPISLTRWETLIGHEVGATVMKEVGQTDDVKKMISILLDAASWDQESDKRIQN